MFSISVHSFRGPWLILACTVAIVLCGCRTQQPRAVIKGHQIFSTGQFDQETETVEAPSADLATAAGGHPGDVFTGTARRAAKTSIAHAGVEDFATIRKLRATLESDSSMRDRDPPISTDASSERTDVEERNVTVHAFIYAVSKEDDHDFHVIAGDKNCASSGCFLNVEVSGWPPDTHSPDRPTLKAVRQSFIDYFDGQDPGTSGYDKPKPPIPVTISGSLFFDMDHKAGTIGPTCCRPSTAWEIHPVTGIEFESGNN